MITEDENVLLAPEETVVVRVRNFNIIIKHNDVGVSIDLYLDTHPEQPEPKEEIQWWFDDYEEE